MITLFSKQYVLWVITVTSQAPRPVTPLLPGDPPRVGGFQLVGRLGSGGMGTVFAGVNGRGERVAIKIIHPSLAGDQEFRARFAREVALLERVRGSCTARVFAADATAEQPWLATEYVPGPTLEQHLRSGGPLSEDELFGLAAGLAEALVAMHQAGVVHRDLKPTNVILSPSGPKVIDFGIARALDETALTKSGTLVGSPGWASPEEYRGESGGFKSDVYGWGLLLAHAASGLPPYGVGRPEVLALRVLNDPVDTTAVPERLRGLVERALAKTPDDRPESDELLSAVVEAWRPDFAGEGDPSSYVTQRLDRTWVMPVGDEAPWPSPARRLRRRWPAAALASIVLAAATVTVLNFGSTDDDSRTAAAPANTSPPKAVSTAAGRQATPRTESSPSPEAQGGHVTWHGLKAPLPSGWRFDKGDVYQAALLPPGENTSRSGLVLSWLGAPQAGQWPAERLDEDNGWQAGDPPYCLAPGSTEEDFALPPGSLIRKERITLKGGYLAEYRAWSVTCENGSRFVTKAWYVPEVELALFSLAADARYSREYDGIVAGLDLSGWSPEAPGGAATFWGMTLTLPPGWDISRVSTDVACVHSPLTRGSSGPWDLPCPPDSLAIEVRAGRQGWPSAELDGPIPSSLSVRSPCLAGGGVTQIHPDDAAEDNPAGAVALYEGMESWKAGRLSTVRLADGRRAAYRSWRMTCELGRQYTTKVWYLPVSRVAVYVLSQHPEDAADHNKIVRSLDLRGFSANDAEPD